MAFAQGIWFLFALWRQRYLNQAGQLHLLVLLSSFLLIIAEVWLLASDTNLSVSVAGWTASLPLFIGPAFYYYAKSLDQSNAVQPPFLVEKLYWHYVPSLALTFLQWFSLLGILKMHMLVLTFAKAISLYGYLIFALALLSNKSDLLTARLRQSGFSFLGLVTIAFLLFIAESLGYRLWLGSDLLAGLSLAVFVYSVSLVVLLDWHNYLLRLQPNHTTLSFKGAVDSNNSSAPTETDKERSQKLDPDTAKMVFDELWQTVQTEHLWRQPQCRLIELSRATGLAEHYLSYVINLIAGCNSQTWINNFRVEEAKQLLIDTDMPVLEIGLKVGFNSKATFNRVFKELTGETPTALRQRRQKDNGTLSR